jgi:hypothetical protein
MLKGLHRSSPDSGRSDWPSYRCLRGCGRAVMPDHLICVGCLLADARRADQAARVLMPEDWQRGTVGAEQQRKDAMAKLKDRDSAVKRIVTATKTDWETFRRLLAAGLSRLLDAVSDRPGMKTWLTRQGVRRSGDGWTRSRSNRCSAGASG